MFEAERKDADTSSFGQGGVWDSAEYTKCGQYLRMSGICGFTEHPAQRPASETDQHSMDTRSLSFRKACKEAEAESADDLKRPPNTCRDTKALGDKFCRETTAHGWGSVARATHLVVRWIWVAITLTALTANILHVLALVAQFLNYPYEIKIAFQASEIAFPSVTICNTLPISLTTFDEYVNDDTTETHRWFDLTHRMAEYEVLAAQHNMTNEFEMYVVNRLMQPVGYFTNIGKEVLPISHQLNDFVVHCSFGLIPCNMSKFTLYQTSQYFNCYTLSMTSQNGDPMMVRTTGPNAGLSLILYLENNNGQEYEANFSSTSNTGNAAGIRFVTHFPFTRPSPTDQGMDVPPGFSANVGLRMHKYTHLGPPYGKCQDEKFVTQDGFTYTLHNCMNSCQQKYIMQECGCVSALLTLPKPNSTDMPYCGQWDVTDQLDLVNYLNKTVCEGIKMLEFTMNVHLREQCKCYPVCNGEEYEEEISYSAWPMEQTQESFLRKIVMFRPNTKAYQNFKQFNISEIKAKNLIAKNFVRLNIFLQGLTAEVYEEKPSYGLPNLFSDLGGTFGLWIGMSFITWCEVIELFIKITCQALYNIVTGYLH